MTRFYAGIGSRETPQIILDQMTSLAQDLCAKGFTLRSGGALGADSAFFAGSTRNEIFLPWKGYNGYQYPTTISHRAIAMAAQFHPAWDRCTQGVQKMHARNCHIVLGEHLNDPVEFIICWTPGGKVVGGTGQALRLAQHYKIPVVNLYYGDAALRTLKSLVDQQPLQF